MLFPVFVMLELKVKNVLKEYLSHARNHVALMEQKYPFHGVAVYRLKEIITLSKQQKSFGEDLFFFPLLIS